MAASWLLVSPLALIVGSRGSPGHGLVHVAKHQGYAALASSAGRLGRVLMADGDEDAGQCEIIGETKEEIWYTCSEEAPNPKANCEEPAGLGVGGGPGILPQDGEVLCIEKKPTEEEDS